MEASEFFRHVLTGVNAGNVDAVVTKAVETLRLMHIKVPSRALRNLEHCRQGVALQLACRGMLVEVPQSRIAKECHAKPQQYANALRTVESLMPQSKESIDLGFVASSLCVGSRRIASDIVDDAERMLRGNDEPAMAAAAFFEAASSHGADIETKDLLRLTGVTHAQFARAREDLRTSGVPYHEQPEPPSSSSGEARHAVASLRAQQLTKAAARDVRRAAKRPLDDAPLPSIAEEVAPPEEETEPDYEEWALAALRRKFPDQREFPPFVKTDDIRTAFNALLNNDIFPLGGSSSSHRKKRSKST